MALATILTGLSALLVPLGGPMVASTGGAAVGEAVAIRVGRAETVSDGTLLHAVVLVEGGKIVAVGEDLPIGRGIRVIDRPDWVLTPGFVNSHSRAGMPSKGGRSFDPQEVASGELYPRQDLWEELLEAGVTTLGLYAAGSGIPGQTVVVRPTGETVSEMIVAERAYLTINLRSNQASKKMLRGAFEKADEYDEKVQKAREKWEKAGEKKKSKSKSKKDKDKDKDDEKSKKKDEEPKEFVAPKPDDKVVPILALRAKTLSAVMRIKKSSDYLHLLDVIEEEDLDWSLHLSVVNETDFYEIAERVGERELRVLMPASIALQPNTLRERNIAAEMQRAGASIVLLPQSDSVESHESWPHDVGRLISLGLDRDAALAGMTLEAARVLGLEDRLGSIEVDKDANLVFWDGDPFEPETRIQAVMLEGNFVNGDLD